MRCSTIARIGTALVLGGCTGRDTSEQRDTATASGAIAPNAAAPADTVTSAPDSAGGMAGIDHSNMPGMGGNTATKASGGQTTAKPAAPMAGMDHSNMPGMSGGPARKSPAGQSAKPAAPMSAMDHSQMNMSGSTPSTPRRTTTTSAMEGMDHSTMSMSKTPTRPAADPAMQKLQQIVAQLVQDSVVQRRIREDSVLRNRWNDPALKRTIGTRP